MCGIDKDIEQIGEDMEIASPISASEEEGPQKKSIRKRFIHHFVPGLSRAPQTVTEKSTACPGIFQREKVKAELRQHFPAQRWLNDALSGIDSRITRSTESHGFIKIKSVPWQGKTMTCFTVLQEPVPVISKAPWPACSLSSRTSRRE